MAIIKTNLTYGTTGNLPAVNGSAVTNLTSGNLSGNLPALNGAALTALNASNVASGTLATARYVQGGIQMYDQWRLTDDLTGNHEPIASNLEAVDTTSQNTIGNAMTQSSGIFTFPTTGIYLVSFMPVQNANAAEDYADFKIQTTTNNSSYNTMAQGFEGATTGFAFGGTILQTTVDVTNVSNVKVRFMSTQSNTSNRIKGQTSYNRTTFTFMRLGST